jgi:hypothetical protein
MHNSKTFNEAAIGEKFNYRSFSYIKTSSSKCIAIDGSHEIDFTPSKSESIVIESDNEQLIKG